MSFKNWFKHFLLYLYHKHKNRHLARFPYSAYLSHRCEFEGMNAVGAHSSFYGKMGMGSYISTSCNISADIGRFSSLGNRISQIVESHPMKEPVVTEKQFVDVVSSLLADNELNKIFAECFGKENKECQ